MEELRAFFGFSILDHLPAIDDYWSRDPHLRYAPIADRISRQRFIDISWYLHFVDNDHLAPRGDPSYDQLGKVRPFIQHLIERFEDVYKPTQNVTVDEAIIKFQGRSSLKQYMPIKPVTMSMHVGVRMYTFVCVCVTGGGGRLAYMCMEMQCIHIHVYTYICSLLLTYILYLVA